MTEPDAIPHPAPTPPPRRSALFVPASNPRAIAKCRSVSADVLIFDLEDAVFPDDKVAARAALAAALRDGGFGCREVVVRVNGLDTPWATADLQAAAGADVDAVLLPKVRTIDAVRRATELLAAWPTRVWAMIETPAAVLDVASLARSAGAPASRLDALVLGTNDLAALTRVPQRAAMASWLSSCVLAARAFGLAILDGVCNALDDEAGLRAECENGRELGMDGKTCVHPAQVPVCNAVFAPSRDEIARARAVLAAFADPRNRGANVLRLDGRMIERLHAEDARRVLAMADAIARRDGL